MLRRSIPLLCAALVAALALAPPARGGEIVIDTDMGLDDVRAIFALLADTSSAVVGIVTVEGSASIGKGTDNLIGLLEKLELDDMPVYRGAARAGAEPPPWRTTADGLAGNTFPPPRHIAALNAREGLRDLIEDAGTPPRYLALGPLGNLAALGPGVLGKIESIWMPAVIEGAVVGGWNLSFDAESAFHVLSRAANIIIVDVGPARGLDAGSILGSVGGSSAAALWIGGLLSGAEGHLMIYDELAALAAIRPDLVTIDPARYAIARNGNDSFRLEPSENGPIRIARFTDPNKTARELAGLWEEAIDGDHHDHDHAHRYEAIDPELYIKTFHGHLGPYLVLGYRMGRIALRELDSEGHFGLSVTVHSKLRPPASCLIDGVQLGSGCTLGKRNIEIAETDGAAYAEFEDEGGGRIRIGLKEGIPRLIGEMIRKSGVEAAGDELFHADEESLFDIERDE